MKFIKLIFITIIAISVVFINSCIAATNQQLKTIIIKPQKLIQNLYFDGMIKPLSTKIVTSPVEGVVIDKNFNYGESVKQGQTLIEINSSKLEDDYNSKLANFLKAKNQYNTSKSKLSADKQLFDLGIISKKEYIDDKNSNDSARIGYLQALMGLRETLRSGQHNSNTITKLDISDSKAVDKALRQPYNFVTVTSNAKGVALLPEKSSSNDSAGGIKIGSQLKLGDVITSVGDLSGISADIKVSELYIDQIKPGQKVKVTGIGFEGETLAGYVKSAGSQAITSSGASSGVPSFPVKIVVPHLTAKQAKLVKVGMSAKIQLALTKKKVLEVPLTALLKKSGVTQVMLLCNDQQQLVKVTTGKTTATDVQIISGLKVGDKVVVNPQAAKQK